jgi:hypothetical protein
MAIKKKTAMKPKIANAKKPKRDSKEKTDKLNEIMRTASELDSEINDISIHDDEVMITEDNYILVSEYTCSLSAHQDPEMRDWRFALEIFTNSGQLIDIHSQQSYETFQDALLDCYGIIEYLGFGITDRDNSANISVNHWNENEERYDEEIVQFDGRDFYKIKKN